jgi:hypothetical protein
MGQKDDKIGGKRQQKRCIFPQLCCNKVQKVFDMDFFVNGKKVFPKKNPETNPLNTFRNENGSRLS